MAAEPPGRRADRAHLALLDVDGVGARAHVLLQRRLPRRHAGRQAPVGARPADARGLGGDLAGHRPPHPARDGDGRRHVGPGAAAVPGAQRLPGGDLPHVLLQPARRRRRQHRRDALRRGGGDRPGDRRPADHDAAGPGVGGRRVRDRAGAVRRDRAQPRAQPGGPAVLARLPARRRGPRRARLVLGPGPRRLAGRSPRVGPRPGRRRARAPRVAADGRLADRAPPRGGDRAARAGARAGRRASSPRA